MFLLFFPVDMTLKTGELVRARGTAETEGRGETKKTAETEPAQKAGQFWPSCLGKRSKHKKQQKLNTFKGP